MAYRVLAVTPLNHPVEERTAFEQEVQATFVKAVHERTSMGVFTIGHGVAFSEYLAEGGARDGWPTYVGEGIDPDYRTPTFNALAFPEAEVSRSEAQMVVGALSTERMVALRLPDGKFRRVTGMSLNPDGSGTLLTDVPPPPPFTFPEDA
jgi:hypothetical protein